MSNLGAGFKLTLLTAAVGAGSIGSAGAMVSTVPAGFTPLTLTTNVDGSYALDVDNDGSTDFFFSSSGTGSIHLATTSANSTFSGFLGVKSYVGSFDTVTGLKPNTSGTLNQPIVSLDPGTANSNFAVGTPSFAELATGVTYDGLGDVTGGTREYLSVLRTVSGSGGLSGGEIDTITISDYGLIDATAVPEPASLALLATGGVGIAALRRRKAARRAG